MFDTSDPRKPCFFFFRSICSGDQVKEFFYDCGVGCPFYECDNEMQLPIAPACSRVVVRRYKCVNLGMAYDRSGGR